MVRANCSSVILCAVLLAAIFLIGYLLAVVKDVSPVAMATAPDNHLTDNHNDVLAAGDRFRVSLMSRGITAEEKDILLIPSDEVLRNMSEVKLVSLYSRYINTMQIVCHQMDRIGSMFDGGKEICIDAYVKPKQPCLVYSFGCNYQLDIEEYMIKTTGVRFTHSIQVTFIIYFTSMKKRSAKQIKNPKGCTFYHIGLGGRNEIDSSKWELYTLDSIRAILSHTQRIIDVLKIDIEGPEWASLSQMKHAGTLRYVRQLLVEFHYWRRKTISVHAQWLATFRHLYEAGFRIFNRERVVCPGGIGFVQELDKTIAYQVEICFININFRL